MLDLSKTAEPKSDQLNADDLVAGPMTLVITGVKLVAGEQPVHIEWQGGKGRPYKPCKSMIRVLITAWGSNGDDYVGRSMVVYCDGSVTWAGSEVGGIRISHLSNIKDKMRMMITISRGKKAPYTVQPLVTFEGNPLTPEALEGWCIEIVGAMTMAELSKIGAKIKKEQYNEKGAADIRAHYQAAVDRIRSAEADSEQSQSLEGRDGSE